MSVQESNSESRKYLEKAAEILDSVNLREIEEDPKVREKVIKASSYLRLAIENEEGDPGDAAERLAWAQFFLNEFENAKRFADLALQQDENSFFAYGVHFLLKTLEYESFRGPNATDIDFTSGAGFITSALFAGVGAARKNSHKQSMLHEARKMAEVFPKIMGNTDWKAIYFLSGASLMAGFADMLKTDFEADSSFMYKAVIDAPWDSLEMDEEQEAELQEILDLCEGSLLL